MVNDMGEQISLVAELDGTGLASDGQYERFEEVNPNDCLLVVSSDYNISKGMGTTVPVHIANNKGEDVIFHSPTLMQIEGNVHLSTTQNISIENETACFDETISGLRCRKNKTDKGTVPFGEVV